MFCRFATMRVANSRYNATAKLQIRQNRGGWSKRTKFEHTPQQNERKLNLQTLEASPLSNRRSERPAEKPPTNNKHSEGVPHLLQYDALILAERFCFCLHFEKTRAEKRKGLILRFSALLLILQGYGLCIGHYKMLYLK